MQHRLSKQATDDLLRIADYYLEYSLRTSESVRDDIDAVFKLLEQYPKSGTLMQDGTRKNVSGKYRYVVSSVIEGDDVVILAVYRYQDRTPMPGRSRT